MNSWIWIGRAVALAVHAEQLREHGGGEGVRSMALLESALARPQQLASYGKPDVFDLAAAYAFGVARNHPFVDGNKRTAWVLARLFIALHNIELRFSDVEATQTMLNLAAGLLDEAAFSQWLRDRSGQEMPLT